MIYRRILAALALAFAAFPALAQYGVPGGGSRTEIVGADIYYTDSTTALGSAASINGFTHANRGIAGIGPSGPGQTPTLPAGPIGHCFFIAEAFADQTGTLYIDKSTDGVTWRQVGSQALATVNTTATLKVFVSATYYRARYVNGATAQTVFLLTSAYTLN